MARNDNKKRFHFHMTDELFSKIELFIIIILLLLNLFVDS